MLGRAVQGLVLQKYQSNRDIRIVQDIVRFSTLITYILCSSRFVGTSSLSMSPTLRPRSNVVTPPSKSSVTTTTSVFATKRQRISHSDGVDDVYPDNLSSLSYAKISDQDITPMPLLTVSAASHTKVDEVFSFPPSTSIAITRPRVPQFTSAQLMNVRPDAPFIDLKVAPAELRPSATLTTGQCFHWTALTSAIENDNLAAVSDLSDSVVALPTPFVSAWGTHDAIEWLGVVRDTTTGESIVLLIRETPTTTLYRVLQAPDRVNVRKVLEDYFQLNVKLSDLYDEWSSQCSRLKTIAACIPGVRVIQQDPWECLVSFLCSSNNNIPRITQMLYHIRRTYGKPLLTIDDSVIYSFPSFDELSTRATEKELKEVCGMGYRAKYLMHTMDCLEKLGGEAYLHKLRTVADRDQVQADLLQFKGVGRKVADCVALFSLNQTDAIPVDTHVWSIARRDYDPKRSLRDAKSITPTIYANVGELFRSRFPTNAGWAHSLLFVAELPSFKAVLPAEIALEMEKFRKKEKGTK